MSLLDKDPEPLILYSSNVKKLLQGYYGDETQFALNPQQNKSEFVFLSSIISADLAPKINDITVTNMCFIAMHCGIVWDIFGLSCHYNVKN